MPRRNSRRKTMHASGIRHNVPIDVLPNAVAKKVLEAKKSAMRRSHAAKLAQIMKNLKNAEQDSQNLRRMKEIKKKVRRSRSK